MKEKKCSVCGLLYRVKISKSLKSKYCSNPCRFKAHIPWNKGKTKKEFSQLSSGGVQKGRTPWNKGKKRPEMTGEKHHFWIKDRTKIKKQHERNNPNDKQWKYAVYKRDNFKCRLLDNHCNGRMEAHHIFSWKDYPELRCNINNGITLCHYHHPRKRVDEKRMIPIFQELLSVSKVSNWHYQKENSQTLKE
jgi:hypothetical protein